MSNCASSTYNEPMNSLHWCSGCGGSTGNNTAYQNTKSYDVIMSHHTQVLSALDDLHYAGAFAKVSNASFAYSPVENIQNSMCAPAYFPMAIKTQYFLSLAYPSVWDATSIGKLGSGDFKNKLDSEDDVMTWLYVQKDFCAGASVCKSMFSK